MRKILIVDDNYLSMFLLKEGIGKRNYDIMEVDDSTKVLEIIEDVKPDLVILDIIMPNLSGFDLLKELTKREYKVVVVSSLDSNEAKKKAFDLGAKNYITKPFSFDNLRTVISDEMAYIN